MISLQICTYSSSRRTCGSKNTEQRSTTLLWSRFQLDLWGRVLFCLKQRERKNNTHTDDLPFACFFFSVLHKAGYDFHEVTHFFSSKGSTVCFLKIFTWPHRRTTGTRGSTWRLCFSSLCWSMYGCGKFAL